MRTMDNGGAAFPLKEPTTSDFEGMTLRDYFAAKAMQALLPTISEFPDENWRYGVALDAYQMADAMLKVRRS